MTEGRKCWPLLFSRTRDAGFSMLINDVPTGTLRGEAAKLVHEMARMHQEDELESSRLFCVKLGDGFVLGWVGKNENVLGPDHPMARDRVNRRTLFAHGLLCEDSTILPGSAELDGLRETLAAELRKACDAVCRDKRTVGAAHLSFRGANSAESTWDAAIADLKMGKVRQILESRTPGAFNVVQAPMEVAAAASKAIPNADATLEIANSTRRWTDRIGRRGVCYAIGAALMVDGATRAAQGENEEQSRDRWTTRVIGAIEATAGAAIALLGRRLP